MANNNTVTMKFTAIHIARITRAIAEKCKELGKELADKVLFGEAKEYYNKF